MSYAEPNFTLGDGSEIEADWVDGTCYLVFRQAWGDCASDCLYSELHYFAVRGGEVERIARAVSQSIGVIALRAVRA